MTRIKLSFLAVAAAALLLPTLAEAARNPFDPAAILHNPRALARYLRLTPAQVEQQKALLEDLRETVEPLRQQQKPLQEDLRDALAAASPAACDVGAIVVEIDEIGDDIREAHVAFDAAFVKILTPEQLTRYNALKDAAREFATES
jgi:Spy/CpxP family protein refolding chaperone